MKRILVGLMLLSSLCFAKDKVEFIEAYSIKNLQDMTNEFILNKKIKNVSVSISTNGAKNALFREIIYVACITYEEE